MREDNPSLPFWQGFRVSDLRVGANRVDIDLEPDPTEPLRCGGWGPAGAPGPRAAGPGAAARGRNPGRAGAGRELVRSPARQPPVLGRRSGRARPWRPAVVDDGRQPPQAQEPQHRRARRQHHERRWPAREYGGRRRVRRQRQENPKGNHAKKPRPARRGAEGCGKFTRPAATPPHSRPWPAICSRRSATSRIRCGTRPAKWGAALIRPTRCTAV